MFAFLTRPGNIYLSASYTSTDPCAPELWGMETQHEDKSAAEGLQHSHTVNTVGFSCVTHLQMTHTNGTSHNVCEQG